MNEMTKYQRKINNLVPVNSLIKSVKFADDPNYRKERCNVYKKLEVIYEHNGETYRTFFSSKTAYRQRYEQ